MIKSDIREDGISPKLQQLQLQMGIILNLSIRENVLYFNYQNNKDMVYWDDKSLEYKYGMTQVFEQQLDDLKEIVPNFYIANATIHFDEHSPHLLLPSFQ